MTPKPIPLSFFLTSSPQAARRLVGKPGSDQSFAFWLLYALSPPSKHAKTPEEKKQRKTEREKAVAMIAKAALNHDEEFFARWARGRKALKAIDPRTSLSPEVFLLAAYNVCTVRGRKTSQSEVIRRAIDFLAEARILGFPNRIPYPGQQPTREQLDAEIEKGGLKTIGWRAYIKKLGMTFPDKAKRGRKTGWRKG
jgi:hypothetical protein